MATGHGLRLCVANAKDIQNEAVTTRVNISAQNIDGNNRKRASYLCQQLSAIPAAEGDNAVPLFRECLPFDCRSQRRATSLVARLQKTPKQLQMRNNVADFESAEIIVRHKIKVRIDFLRVIRRQLRAHCRG